MSGEQQAHQAPADMSVRERSAYLGLLNAGGSDGVARSPGAVLASYIARTSPPWRTEADSGQKLEVRVSVELLSEVAQALMGLDARLVRGVEDAIANAEHRALSQRHECAREWVAGHGFDKHGVAEWLRSGKGCD